MGDVGWAIQRLEEAREAAPDDPSIANDLAVAHLIQAQLSNDLRSWLTALETIDLALELDPGLPAAHFNRALLLSSLTLDDAAVDAWRRFDAVEPDSSWRREGRARAAKLREPRARDRWLFARAEFQRAMSGEVVPDLGPLVRSHPQQSRIFLEDELLPAWGEALEAGDVDRAERLQHLAMELARDLPPDRVGPYLHSALRVNATAPPGPQRALATAHRLYGEARRAHEVQNYEKAAPLYRRAAAFFEEFGSPFRYLPRFYLGVRKHYTTRPDYAGAAEDFEDLLRRLPSEEIVLRAYAHWMIGYSRTMEASWAEAVPPLQEALRLFEIAGELENAGAMHNLLAGAWRNMGELGWASEAQGRAVALRRHMVKSRHSQNVVSEIGEQLISADRWATAIYFADEWVREAERSGSAMSRSLARAQRAQVLESLGRTEQALADLHRSSAEADQVEGQGARFRTRLHVALEKSKVLVAGARSDEALEVLEEAGRLSESTDTRHRLMEILLSKAAVERTLRDPEAAQSTLEQAHREVFRQRSLLFDGWQRRKYLDQARGVMEALVDVQLELGLDREALETVETTRSLELMTLVRRRLHAETWKATSEVRPASSPASAPVAPQAMVYLALPERLVVWTIRDGAVETRQVEVSRHRLDIEVESFIQELKHGTSSSSPAGGAGRRLARWLLPAGWSPPTHLRVVADGPLHRLPFSALPVEEKGERLLVQSTAVSHLPSLEVGNLLSQVDRMRAVSAGARPDVLLVSDIPHSGESFPGLARVGHADELERLWASRFQGRTLRRSQAVPAAFLREYPLHSVVVFSGHSLSGSRGGRRGLVLAPGSGGDGFLAADEIAAVAAGRCRLVVLASCSGASGAPSPSEGPRSLVAAFFAAGVPTVIASLTEVEDGAASAFLLELPLEVRRPPADALRLAQLKLIEQGHPPAAWAFFQSHGSSREEVPLDLQPGKEKA